ncbi:hypothetical protein ZWY2020_028336 [Hordeum vulgare]|nr:hypothetical protein ZWY2020_028336 [Hordeum vulgare]
MSGDTLDKLVVFLAKRDGVDKLVKTYQYVSKLAHWRPSRPTRAWRAGQELGDGGRAEPQGVPVGPVADGAQRAAAVPGGVGGAGGDGQRRRDGLLLLRPLHVAVARGRAGALAGAPDELRVGLRRVRRLRLLHRHGPRRDQARGQAGEALLLREGGGGGEGKEEEEGEVRRIRADRVMRLMGTAANLADLVIAVADIEPNPFCNHAVTLGISGLVSAWAGWYRNWPS